MKRYARRLVHDEAVASKIVQHALESENIPYLEMPDTRLRQVLKFDVLNHCIYHSQSKIFDRSLIKVPLHKHFKTMDENDKSDPSLEN